MARTATKAKRKPISAASSAQRKAVKDRACLVCAAQPCDPAHVLPRGVLTAGQDDERAVIPLCRLHHSLFEEGKLDALPFLEPHWRDVLAFAVERYGLLRTLEQVTGLRWTPVPQEDR